MKLRKAAFWVVCLLIGGCEAHASCGGRTLDMKNAEALVRKAVLEQTGAEAKVTCPGKVKIEKGGRFDCTIVIDDVKAVATLEQKDDKTYVEVVSVKGMLVSKALEATLAAKLKGAAAVEPKVDCGPRVHASTPGASFRCKATDANGATAEVVIKVKDDEGNVDFELDQTSIRQAGQPEAPPAPSPP